MANEQFVSFRGKPLIRHGNIIFYGDLNDKYYTMLTILDTTPNKDLQMAGKVEVQLLLTDKTVSAKEALIKKAEKEGLYQAMEIAALWLERANAEE